MGRAAKPIPLRILEGNPGHRPIPPEKNRVRPKPIAPKRPAWLDNIAKREWARVAPELERLCLLTLLDGAALAIYCQAYSIARGCAKAIADKGGVQKYLAGQNSQTIPELTAMWKAMDKMKSMCGEFGMTPSARARMTVAGDEGEEDEFEKLLD